MNLNIVSTLFLVLVMATSMPILCAAGPEDKPLVGRTVLLVDDNQLILTTGAMLLEGLLGMKVATAQDGQKALDIVVGGGRDFDVILMGFNMPPGMNGLETSQQLRQMGYEGAIIAFTGERKDNEHVRAGLTPSKKSERAVFTGYVYKPATAAVLQTAIIDALASLRE